jgi:hypothetical protein
MNVGRRTDSRSSSKKRKKEEKRKVPFPEGTAILLLI